MVVDMRRGIERRRRTARVCVLSARGELGHHEERWCRSAW